MTVDTWPPTALRRARARALFGAQAVPTESAGPHVPDDHSALAPVRAAAVFFAQSPPAYGRRRPGGTLPWLQGHAELQRVRAENRGANTSRRTADQFPTDRSTAIYGRLTDRTLLQSQVPTGLDQQCLRQRYAASVACAESTGSPTGLLHHRSRRRTSRQLAGPLLMDGYPALQSVKARWDPRNVLTTPSRSPRPLTGRAGSPIVSAGWFRYLKRTPECALVGRGLRSGRVPNEAAQTCRSWVEGRQPSLPPGQGVRGAAGWVATTTQSCR